VVSVENGGTAPAEVARFPGSDLIEALAVDPAGEWLYVSGSDLGGERSDTPIIPIDLRSGDVAEPVPLCDNIDVTDMAVTPDGESLLVATNCVDRGVHSVLFTLR
jgi:hypothetical protein